MQVSTLSHLQKNLFWERSLLESKRRCHERKDYILRRHSAVLSKMLLLLYDMVGSPYTCSSTTYNIWTLIALRYIKQNAKSLYPEIRGRCGTAKRNRPIGRRCRGREDSFTSKVLFIVAEKELRPPKSNIALSNESATDKPFSNYMGITPLIGTVSIQKLYHFIKRFRSEIASLYEFWTRLIVLKQFFIA